MQTPLLLIDKSNIIAKYQQLKRAFSNFSIAYAIKANTHQQVLQTLIQQNSDFEVASQSELNLLLKLKVKPYKIVFSNPIKPIEAIKTSLKNSVRLMSFDSIEELEKFKPFIEQGLSPRLLLRIEVSNEGSLWPLTKKFGCPFSMIEPIFNAMQKWNIPLEGFTFHIGSQNESIKSWVLALQKVKQAAHLAKKYYLNYKTLNVGGGFPIHLGRDIPKIESIAKEIYNELEKLKLENVFFENYTMEPGRYLVGESGTLVAKIIGIAQRESNKWVYLDLGVFGGMMETIDGITYPTTSSSKSLSREKVTLCGPSCDSLDKMFEVEIPTPQIGDYLYFTGAGAYTNVYASNFNGFKKPKVICK